MLINAKCQDNVDDSFELGLPTEPTICDYVGCINHLLATIKVMEEINMFGHLIDFNEFKSRLELGFNTNTNPTNLYEQSLKSLLLSLTTTSLEGGYSHSTGNNNHNSHNHHVTEIIKWFDDNFVDVTVDNRIIYAEALVANNITSIRRLQKAIDNKDDLSFIHKYDLEDIVEAVTKQYPEVLSKQQAEVLAKKRLKL